MQARLSPLDRLALVIMAALSAVIVVLVGGSSVCGDSCWLRAAPRVREFTWDERAIGRQDRAFILTFSRPVERASVETNLTIEPPLPGKFSWAGRRAAYTLNAPAAYGTEYRLQLDGARALVPDSSGSALAPFASQFWTRDRAFAYIGVDGEEQGRLIVYNLTDQHKFILTPPDLVVTDFEPYPEGDRILFAATSRSVWRGGSIDPQLYRTSTEIVSDRDDAGETVAPELELVLDNREYQILQFDLAPDGEHIVVRRSDRANGTNFGLWVLSEDAPPRPLDNPIGGEFAIAPDGQTIALTRGEGIALLPLEPESDPLDFLPQYGQVLDFALDGSAAAMVDFNTDNPQQQYVRSLYLVNNRGRQQNLLDTDGSIRDCQFDPTARTLYCLLGRFVTDSAAETFAEEPYLVAIDLATSESQPLLSLPVGSQDIQFDLAPDGLALLFDQVVTLPEGASADAPRADSGNAIAGSRLWLLVPTLSSDEPAELEELPLLGFHPRWLP